MSAPQTTVTEALRTDCGALARPRTLAAVLSVVSGYVDAFVFLRVTQVFTANQSGNLILGGVALGSGEPGKALYALASVCSYIAGAAAVIALFDRPDGGRRRVVGVVAIQTVVLGAAAAVLAVWDMGQRRGGPVVAITLVVASAALSMGAQATAVRSAAGVPVLTTAGSGAVTNIGIALGRLTDPVSRPAVPHILGTVGATVVGYTGGAALGALLSTYTGIGAPLMLVPVPVLGTMLLVVLRNAHEPGQTSSPARPRGSG